VPGTGGRHDEALAGGGILHALAGVHLGHLGAQRGVLALEALGGLHRLTDAGVEAQERQLQEDEADEHRAHEDDPDAPADEPVKETRVRDAGGPASQPQAQRSGQDAAAGDGGSRADAHRAEPGTRSGHAAGATRHGDRPPYGRRGTPRPRREALRATGRGGCSGCGRGHAPWSSS
jgi:hypothetical protein